MGTRVKCSRCRYRGRFLTTVTDLSNVACPMCRGKLEFINPQLGVKKMAKVKAKIKRKRTKAKARKKARRKAGAKKGAPRIIGRFSKLGVTATWVRIFKENVKHRLTDKQISAQMKKEFPGRKSKIFDFVQMVRNRYNKGALTQGQVPARISQRYDSAGKVVTARGKRK